MSELARSGELNGLKMAEVQELLGPPDSWIHHLCYDITSKGFSGSIVVHLASDSRVTCVFGSGWNHTSEAPADRPFDRDAWRTSSVAQASMVRDLVSGRALVGKSVDEVVELLGPATEVFGPTACYSGRIGELRRASGPALRLQIDGQRVQASEYGGS